MWMILPLAPSPLRNLKCPKRHPLYRRNHKMRQIILRQPRPQVRRQKKRLISVEWYKIRHKLILNHSEQLVNPTGC